MTGTFAGASRVVVLVLAAGAGWEPAVLTRLDSHPRLVVLKRCVDVDDLLAAASSGQADAAVAGVDAPGLDARAVEQLRHLGIRPVLISPAGANPEHVEHRTARLGAARSVAEDALDTLPAALLAPEQAGPTGSEPNRPDWIQSGPASAVPSRREPIQDAPARPGRVIAVWGPAGAPGRSTVAAAVAAELGRRGPVLLVDADPGGGTVAQQLGMLDEVSGLLQASRLAAGGRLADGLAETVRMLSPNLGVITGLPRPDRWSELCAGLVEELAAVGRRGRPVVLDTGSSLEEDPTAELNGRPGRHQLTLDAVEVADEILVVGTPDPVGLTRLVRALVDLRERGSLTPVRVVINRMRPSLRWSERDIAGMLSDLVPASGWHFLPEDRTSTDKALVSGRTLLEVVPEVPLTRGVTELVDALVPHAAKSR